MQVHSVTTSRETFSFPSRKKPLQHDARKLRSGVVSTLFDVIPAKTHCCPGKIADLCRNGSYTVVPAKAGTQRLAKGRSHWAPAFAGMTVGYR